MKSKIIPAPAGAILLSLYIDDETKQSTLREQLVIGWGINKFAAHTIVWGPRRLGSEDDPWDVVLELPDGRCLDNSQDKMYRSRAEWIDSATTSYLEEAEKAEEADNTE